MTPQVADPEKEPLKSALEALRESKEFKTRLIEGSRDCLKVLDLEGRLLSMNAGGMAALEMLKSCLWPGNIRELEHGIERVPLQSLRPPASPARSSTSMAGAAHARPSDLE